MPDPQLRSGFKIPNVERWVRKHRGELIAALLTLIRAWDCAGRPTRQASSDGFGEWLGAINGILGVADIPGTCDEASARGQHEGEEDAEWAGFLEAIAGAFGSASWTARDVLAKVNTTQGPSEFAGVVAAAKPIAIDELPSELSERVIKLRAEPTILTKSLGKWLANRKGRWAGGRTVREVPSPSTKHASKWRIEHYQPQNTEGNEILL
jgi:hypothetical protein